MLQVIPFLVISHLFNNFDKCIIDNGSTDHIVLSSDLLNNKSYSSHSYVGLPDGEKAQIASIQLNLDLVDSFISSSCAFVFC